MVLKAPDLDDRRYDDLLEEVRTLMPRYAPEQTDLTDSQPAILIAKLFCWMTDLTLYRVNRIPERAYVKFLELIDVTPKPASPARTELSFTPARQDVPDIVVPAGTQVAAAADEDGPILFETLEPLSVVATPLVEVQVYDGFGYQIATTRARAEGQTIDPFGPLARDGSALLLGFQPTADFTAQDISLLIRLPRNERPPTPLSCNVAIDPLPADLVWEVRNATGWEPISTIRDNSRAFTQDGYVRIAGPGTVARQAIVGEVQTPLYWLRCRLQRGAYERPPRLDSVLINAVPAHQASTATEEFLGRSDGRPDQSFTLANLPVVPRDRPLKLLAPDGVAISVPSLRLEVDEGQGFVPWQEVPDFLASGPDDRHFTLNHGTGLVTLGDNRRGRIPIAVGGGEIVAQEYFWGGGRRGNLAAGTVTQIQSFVAGIEEVTNPFAAEGGAEEEPVEDVKRRAAAEIASNGRAVTAADFETRALSTPGARIRRAHAVARFHPQFPGAEVPGVVTVIVVPDGDGPAPMPSASTLTLVCKHLDTVRLMTSEVHVAPPRYREVRVAVTVEARPDADAAEVRRLVEQRLDSFFHPLEGGLNPATGDPGAGGLPFGATIFVSDLFQLILGTDGVARLADGQMEVRVDGEASQFCRDIPLCPNELTCAKGHDVTVRFRGNGS